MPSTLSYLDESVCKHVALIGHIEKLRFQLSELACPRDIDSAADSAVYVFPFHSLNSSLAVECASTSITQNCFDRHRSTGMNLYAGLLHEDLKDQFTTNAAFRLVSSSSGTF